MGTRQYTNMKNTALIDQPMTHLVHGHERALKTLYLIFRCLGYESNRRVVQPEKEGGGGEAKRGLEMQLAGGTRKPPHGVVCLANLSRHSRNDWLRVPLGAPEMQEPCIISFIR